MSDKLVIFISHSSIDKAVARELQKQIEVVFGGKDNVTVFNSSDPYAIPSGGDWFNEITKQLRQAKAMVVLVTSSAKQSIWVGFEIGYFWNKTKGKFVYPVAVPGARMFGPLEKLQAKALDDMEQIEAFIHHVCKDFGLGDPSKADGALLIEKAIHNARELISEVEIRTRIREFLLDRYKSSVDMTYSSVDIEMQLPEGSAAKYLPQVMYEPELRDLWDGNSWNNEKFRIDFFDED